MRNPSADFSQTAGGGFHVRGAVDGNDRTGWSVYPEFNKDHRAVFDLAETIGDGQAARLTVRLKQGNPSYDKTLLGRFRLSFTNDATTLQATRDRLDLNNSDMVDVHIALGEAHAQQGQTNEAVAAFVEALPLAADRAGKTRIIAAAAPVKGVLETLAERAAGDGLFQAELARHFDKQGNAPLAAAARASALAFFKEKHAKEPENSTWAGELADLLMTDPTGWTVLKPAEMKADGGATMTRLEDDSILVSGPNPEKDVYVLTFRDLPAKFQHLRLEVLPHQSLPHNGPGRSPENGNFVLTTIKAQLDPPTNKGEPRSLKLAKAFADFSQQEFSVAGAIDANDNTGWAIHPEEGKPHFAVFKVVEPVTETAGTVLRVTLECKWGQQHNLGRFRLSVSPDPATFDREEKRLAVLKLTDPWAKLAAAYHVLGDQAAHDTLVKQHPAAAAGIGDLYAAAKDWERAIAEYRKAVTDQPADSLLIKLAAAYQSAGRTREAVPHLAQASAANPNDTLLALKLAALQAWFGQDKEFAATRKRFLAFAKATGNADMANTAAKIHSVTPSTDKGDLEAARTLGHTAVKLHRNEWTLLAPGMAEYRSGNYTAADEALLQAASANRNNPYVQGTAAFYRAMSLFRQGKADEARKVASAATAQMKPLPKDEQNPLVNGANWDDLILWLACKEAQALMQPEAIPPPRAENDPRGLR